MIEKLGVPDTPADVVVTPTKGVASSAVAGDDDPMLKLKVRSSEKAPKPKKGAPAAQDSQEKKPVRGVPRKIEVAVSCKLGEQWVREVWCFLDCYERVCVPVDDLPWLCEFVADEVGEGRVPEPRRILTTRAAAMTRGAPQLRGLTETFGLCGPRAYRGRRRC